MRINDGMNASRRAFLKRASALSLAGAATPWALNLAAIAEASAATVPESGYKAIVCVFLNGGNDYANTLAPYDPTNYNLYSQRRPALAYARNDLQSTALLPSVVPLDADKAERQYALAPQLLPLKSLFDDGKMGIVLNVGTLVQPTTKVQYINKSAPLPPKLFSHNDQQSVWQSSMPEGATSGWGGRMGDLFESRYGKSTFTCVNVSGNAVFLSGGSAVQYQVSTGGSVPLSGIKSPLFGSQACSDALSAIVSEKRAHLFEEEYDRVMRRSMLADSVLSTKLVAPSPAWNFPAKNALAAQLKLVARMIGSAQALGLRRQVFFVSLGGFDLHDNLLDRHPPLLTQIADALSAFYAATVDLNVADKVTTFTASDFGRALNANKDNSLQSGTDHGWGGMHFVIGGAVNGKCFYGTPPRMYVDSDDDIGQGRLLPTTSVDQYAATLGKWMGISDSNLLDLLPNLKNWSGKTDLGFLQRV